MMALCAGRLHYQTGFFPEGLMSRQLSQSGSRTYLAGKIISNYGQSTIDCVVRRISDDGATVAVENALGIPEGFQLLIADEGNPRPCKLVWQSDRQLGLTFEDILRQRPKPNRLRRNSDPA
jgi:hypothetical protein